MENVTCASSKSTRSRTVNLSVWPTTRWTSVAALNFLCPEMRRLPFVVPWRLSVTMKQRTITCGRNSPMDFGRRRRTHMEGIRSAIVCRPALRLHTTRRHPRRTLTGRVSSTLTIIPQKSFRGKKRRVEIIFLMESNSSSLDIPGFNSPDSRFTSRRRSLSPPNDLNFTDRRISWPIVAVFWGYSWECLC